MKQKKLHAHLNRNRSPMPESKEIALESMFQARVGKDAFFGNSFAHLKIQLTSYCFFLFPRCNHGKSRSMDGFNLHKQAKKNNNHK